jgi:hypothetical protein
MVHYYNCCRTPTLKYKPGDKVFLDAGDTKTMWPHFLGPYVIQRQGGPNTYHLILPHLISCLHLIFNMVKLKPTPKDPIAGRFPPPSLEPVLKDGELEYEVG